ncbi:MAG: hypothetical protein LVR00_02575 [Rhabdochlamydiaceae bacterium]|jgi:hypothetical protein
MVKLYGRDKIQIMPIFLSNGSINPDCSDAMQQTFLSTSPKHTKSIITDDQFTRFINALEPQKNSEKAPLAPLEQVIFVVRDTPIKHDDPTIRDAIYVNTGINLFSRFTDKNGQKKVMTAPVGVIDKFLKTACRDYIQPHFVMGLSTPGQLEEIQHRDVMLPFDNITCPETADGFPVPDKKTFLFHDLNYHCFLAGSVPEKARKKFIQIARLTLALVSKDNDPMENRVYLELYERFVDMEFPPYRQNLSHLFKDDNDKFIESFNSAFVAAHARIEQKDPFIDLEELSQVMSKAREKIKSATHLMEKGK